jgi:hypothetical protein
MMKNTFDELLDFVQLGRYDVGEVGGLLRRIENIYAGGTGTTAWLDHNPSGMGGHEVRDLADVRHRREIGHPNPGRPREHLHRHLVAVNGCGDGAESGQVEFATEHSGSVDVDFGQSQDRPGPVPLGGRPGGVQHRVIVGVVGDDDNLGEPVADLDTSRGDRHELTALLRKPLSEGQTGVLRADQHENHDAISSSVTTAAEVMQEMLAIERGFRNRREARVHSAQGKGFLSAG